MTTSVDSTTPLSDNGGGVLWSVYKQYQIQTCNSAKSNWTFIALNLPFTREHSSATSPKLSTNFSIQEDIERSRKNIPYIGSIKSKIKQSF